MDVTVTASRPCANARWNEGGGTGVSAAQLAWGGLGWGVGMAAGDWARGSCELLGAPNCTHCECGGNESCLVRRAVWAASSRARRPWAPLGLCPHVHLRSSLSPVGPHLLFF